MTHRVVRHGDRSLILDEKFKKLDAALVYKVWGGKELAKYKKVPALNDFGEALGETWELSMHADGPSEISGSSLEKILSKDEMPFLVKLIDTEDNLSVQVHPDDDFASEHENSLGKTECWLILDASEGSGIYLGMKKGVLKENFEQALKSKANMNDFLVFYPVEKGDFFYVPAGTIHAIGKGVFLAEVQQSSGITYRVWDWNRLDAAGNSRALHIEKALSVIRFGDEFNSEITFKNRKNVFQNGVAQIVEHAQFNLRQITLNKNQTIAIDSLEKGRVTGLLNLDGEIFVDGLGVGEYQSVLRAIGSDEVNVKAKEAGSFLLVE